MPEWLVRGLADIGLSTRQVARNAPAAPARPCTKLSGPSSASAS